MSHQSFMALRKSLMAYTVYIAAFIHGITTKPQNAITMGVGASGGPCIKSGAEIQSDTANCIHSALSRKIALCRRLHFFFGAVSVVGIYALPESLAYAFGWIVLPAWMASLGWYAVLRNRQFDADWR